MVEFVSGLTHKIGDKVIHIITDKETTLEQWKDALIHFMKHVGQIEDANKTAAEQAKAKAEAEIASKAQTPVTEEVKPE